MSLNRLLPLLAVISVAVFSCVADLTYYHEGYVPSENPNLRFDGYYAAKARRQQSYPMTSLTPKHFYPNGFVAHHQYWITKFKEPCTKKTPHKKLNGDAWGVYKINGAAMTVEYLQWDQIHFERITNQYVIAKDTLFIFTYSTGKGKIKELVDTLYFHPYPYKPDSSRSYLKKMHRYKKKEPS